LCTFDAWRLEWVTLAGVGRPSFLTVPWAIVCERDVEFGVFRGGCEERFEKGS
jgi:hypothetical protein